MIRHYIRRLTHHICVPTELIKDSRDLGYLFQNVRCLWRRILIRCAYTNTRFTHKSPRDLESYIQGRQRGKREYRERSILPKQSRQRI